MQCVDGYYAADGKCVLQAKCTAPKVSDSGSCVDSCPVGSYADNGRCVRRCPSGSYFFNSFCYNTCPTEANLFTDYACVSSCPKGSQ